MSAEGTPVASERHGGLGLRRRLTPYGLLAPSGLVLAFLLVLPLGLLLYTSLQSGGAFSGGLREQQPAAPASEQPGRERNRQPVHERRPGPLEGIR